MDSAGQRKFACPLRSCPIFAPLLHGAHSPITRLLVRGGRYLMRRTLLLLTVIALCPLVGLFVWLSRASGPRIERDTPARAGGRAVPLAQVVLFNTGVGYFYREGEV